MTTPKFVSPAEQKKKPFRTPLDRLRCAGSEGSASVNTGCIDNVRNREKNEECLKRVQLNDETEQL